MMKSLHKLVALGCLAFGMIACSSAKVESARIVQDGVKFYEAKQLDKALATFKNAVARDPNNDKAYEWMAQIELDYRNYNAAVQYLELAAGIYDDPKYWCKMGNAHMEYGRDQLRARNTSEASLAFGKCTSEMKRALEHDQYYADAHLGLARCYLGMNRYDDAANAYEKAIRANPTLRTNGVAAQYQELGALYQKFGFFREAQTVLDNGLMNNPDDGQLETTLADVLYDTEQYDLAIAHYTTAIQTLSRLGQSQATQLTAYYGAGRASAALAQSLELSERHEEVPGIYNQAIKYYEQFIALAVSDEDSIRKADAVERIREINSKLEWLGQ